MAQRGAGAAAGARPSSGTRPGGRGGSAEARHGREDSRAAAARSASELAALRVRLRSVIEPCVISAGFDLEDLAVLRAGRRHVIRVTVDSDDGVNHDDLSALSRHISAGLDEAEQANGDATPDGYTLEVSSPGIDRPLTEPRHWRRNIGRLIKVKADDRQLTGRIVAVEDGTVTFDTGTGQVVVPLARLGSGRVEVEFNHLAELAEADFGEAFDDSDDLDDDGDDSDDDSTDDDSDTDDSDPDPDGDHADVRIAEEDRA
jgi:ribosome maturation factor RimP